jgi:hypothetical protein
VKLRVFPLDILCGTVPVFFGFALLPAAVLPELIGLLANALLAFGGIAFGWSRCRS